MAKYILLFVVLSFTLTTTASSAMACCWDMNKKEEIVSEMPCHDMEKPDKNETQSLNCCSDMMMCKVPLVFDTATSNLIEMVVMYSDSLSIGNQLSFTNNTMPPTPPPKYLI